MITVAESFRRFRDKFNLSKTDVANTLNIKLAGYKYENPRESGNGRMPGAETLIKLAKAYNISTDYLLGLTDEPRPLNPKVEVQEVQAVDESKNLTVEEELANHKERLAKLEEAVAKLAS